MYNINRIGINMCSHVLSHHHLRLIMDQFVLIMRKGKIRAYYTLERDVKEKKR